jgi:ABC-type antimicrobial peptide transport system permease subunit
MDFALPHKIRSSLEENGSIYLSTYNNQGTEAYQELDTEITDILVTNVSEISEVVHGISSPWAFPWEEDALIVDERINLRSIAGIESRIEIFSGNLPENSGLELNSFQVLISKQISEAYKLEVGDRLPLSKKNSESEPSFWIEVAGIFQPSDARDPYWMINNDLFRSKNNSRYQSEYSVILLEVDFFTVVENIFPNGNLELNWLGFIDPGQIKSENVSNIVDGLNVTRLDISNFERKVTLNTNLDHFLERFQVQASTIRSPLYLLIVEVLFLCIYYVVMVAALSVNQVKGELATITSRGASTSQLLQFQAFEALIICVAALIFGPLIANVFVRSLANIGPLSDISQTDWAANLTSASWIAAGISVLACFTALLIPVIPILRSSVVQHRQDISRRSKNLWWQRYYVDVFFLAIGLIAMWRLGLYGSISGLNGERTDWILLFAPLALLIGSAAVLSRIFPVIYRILANLASRARGLTASLAFWQASRDPTHVTRLVLLFTFAMALGILSTGLNATLNLSEWERARYSSGGEARITHDTFIPLSTFNSIPLVTSASSVWRGTGKANVRSYRNMPGFSLLAVEPFSFATVSQYRMDFTDDYIGFVLGQLIVDPESLPVSTVQLSSRPVRFGVWIADPYPERTDVNLLEYLSVRAKVKSSEGEINTINLELTPLENEKVSNEIDSGSPARPQIPTWRYFETELEQYANEGYPLSLHSLWIKIRPFAAGSGPIKFSQGPLIIDDFSIQDLDGQTRIIEDFEVLSTIWQTDNPQSIASYTKNEITHSGDASMRLYLGPPGSSIWMVMSPAHTIRKELIPVLASPVFLESTGLNVGDNFTVLSSNVSVVVEIKNAVNYFPTMYDTEDHGYLIISRDALLAEVNKASRFPVNYNETWIRVDNTQEIPALLEMFPQATRAWEVETERKVYKSDPLTLGLRSVIFLGYSLTLILSLVGFGTYFYLSARQRGAIYGILRSLGLSTKQLYSSLVLEQLVLILSGLGLGIFLGSSLNRVILPGLPISYGDVPAIPPFFPQEDWTSVIRLLLIMLIGFILTLALGTYLLWRAELHMVLRVGEE